MFRKYPAVMSGARPITDERTGRRMTSFETYARGELGTYSDRTLERLQADQCLKAGAGYQPVGRGLRFPGPSERLPLIG